MSNYIYLSPNKLHFQVKIVWNSELPWQWDDKAFTNVDDESHSKITFSHLLLSTNQIAFNDVIVSPSRNVMWLLAHRLRLHKLPIRITSITTERNFCNGVVKRDINVAFQPVNIRFLPSCVTVLFTYACHMHTTTVLLLNSNATPLDHNSFTSRPNSILPRSLPLRDG